MNKFSVNRVKKKKVDYTKEDVRMADEYIKVINTRSDGINKEVPRHEMAG